MDNNKGFTLIELLATIIILALVMSIASYSIIGIMNNSKKKNYEYLIQNIKSGAETYYQECKYSRETTTDTGITCNEQVNSNRLVFYQVSLGDLVRYGYLKGNSKYDNNDDNNKNKYTLVNPNDNKKNRCNI